MNKIREHVIDFLTPFDDPRFYTILLVSGLALMGLLVIINLQQIGRVLIPAMVALMICIGVVGLAVWALKPEQSLKIDPDEFSNN